MTTKSIGRSTLVPKPGGGVKLVRKRGYMAGNRAKKADREAKNWAKKQRVRTP